MHQVGKSEDCCQHTADKINNTCTDDVAHAFDVAHDARHQRARTIFVVEAHAQAPDMFLHPHAQLGNQPLPRFAQCLREGVGGDSLQNGRAQHGGDDDGQPIHPAMDEDRIDQRLERDRQDQRSRTVYQHQAEAHQQQSPPWQHQGLDFWPDLGQHCTQLRLGLCVARTGTCSPTSGRRVYRTHPRRAASHA